MNIIRREGQLSRKQLTEISGLSVGAVSGIVTELLHDDWIVEIGEGAFTGGRRQTIIKLNPHAGNAMGIKLMEDRVVVAITDFESTIKEYYEKPISPKAGSQKIVDELASIIFSIIEDSHIKFDKLFGIGIGLAGVINSKEGLVQYSPFFGWRKFPLAHMLEKKVQRPVFIENDVNTLTLTEQLFGAGSHIDNFVVITIGRGIGLGIVINNQLYQGINGGAGEFGHMVICHNSEAGSRSAFATLEELAADPAIVRQMAKLHEDQANIKRLQDVVMLAHDGNQDAIRLLSESGTHIGAGLANVINLLNPKLMIISGEGTIAGDLRLQPLINSLRAKTFDGLLDDLEIIIEPTDDKSWARGAASLVISKVFESPIVEANLS